jgi:hypothetical protein
MCALLGAILDLDAFNETIGAAYAEKTLGEKTIA